MNKLPGKYVLNRCSQCGGIFTKENMIEYETIWVCAACKPVFMKKIKEGIEIVPKPANMIGWKIFFFIFLALQLFSFALSIQQIFDAEKLFESILDLIVGPFVIVALFGFSFEKKIWNRTVWKILFPIAMLSNISGIVLLFFREPSLRHRIAIIVVIFAFLPLYIFEFIALYKYAFSKRKPWI